MFNCDFIFNILALVLSEILGGPKFTLGRPVPPVRPRVKCCTGGEYFTMSNDVFNFNFLALLLFEILEGPKFTPPGCPLAKKFFYRSDYFTISN